MKMVYLAEQVLNQMIAEKYGLPPQPRKESRQMKFMQKLKPCDVIVALEWQGDNFKELQEFFGAHKFDNSFISGAVYFESRGENNRIVKALPGEWIVKYPWTDMIHVMTAEMIKEYLPLPAELETAGFRS